MKRLVKKCSVLLSFCIAFMCVVPFAARAEVKFTDVDPQNNQWAYNSIYLMAEKGILTGYPDGRFRPEQPVSRAEWTVMVSRLFDKYRPNLYANASLRIAGYSDVPREHWAYKEISEMYDGSFPLGAYGVNERGELRFRPDEELTRLQLAQMMYGYFDNRLMDRRMSDSDVCTVMSGFRDVSVQLYADPDDYADAQGDGRYVSNGKFNDDAGRVFPTLFMSRGAGDCRFGADEFSKIQAVALSSLNTSGIITADSGYFRPLAKLTRAEAVTILDRMYNFLYRNGWLAEYSTKDLNSKPGSGGGTSGNSYNPSTGTDLGGSIGYPGSSGAYNPDNPYQDGVNPWSVNMTDYFDDQGVIVKDLQNNGEIETAVDVGDNKYLTINLKSEAKVDLYVVMNGKIGFIKQEELPITLPVEGMGQVGIKSQKRDDKTTIVGMNATLSVQLSKEPPSKSKSSSKKK